MRKIVTFRLDEQLFGLEVLLVREINQQMEITAVQRAPDHVRGLINLRGRIVTILDLGVQLDLAPRRIGPDSHNIILKTNKELAAVRQRYERDDLKTGNDEVGLLADAIGDVVEIDEFQVDPPPASVNKISGRFLSGVAKLDGDLLVLLDVESVLAEKVLQEA